MVCSPLLTRKRRARWRSHVVEMSTLARRGARQRRSGRPTCIYCLRVTSAGCDDEVALRYVVCNMLSVMRLSGRLGNQTLESHRLIPRPGADAVVIHDYLTATVLWPRRGYRFTSEM